MFDQQYIDELMTRAIEREPMGDAELRDFAEAIIEDRTLAEEFVWIRRMIDDVADLPRLELNAKLIDQIMDAVRQAPAPAPDLSLSPKRSFAVVAVLLVLLAAAAQWLTRLSVHGWVSTIFSWSWLEWVSSAPGTVAAAWSGWLTGIASSPWATALIWIGIVLPAFAAGLNYWSIRQADHQTNNNHQL